MPSGETTPRGGGKYRPIATLGEGGMARVLLTVSSGPAGVQKLLVVKEIRPELAKDSDFVTMFLDEARLAARLSHPNVIQTYEVGIEEAGPFIVMEYLDGQSLQALISQVKRANLPLAIHLRILTKVLSGLHYAHELRDYGGTPLTVVHRDVSPHNVFVGYDGHVKVVDFGVAKVAGTAERTAAGTFKGKIGYIAPEQLSGDEEVDRRADVFSVGVMLWEALAQRRLTANETAASVVQKRLSGIIPSIRDLKMDVDAELAAICDKATAFAARDRFSSAAEMQEALEAYLDAAGYRADEREIGVLVSQAFSIERARIRTTIEQQMGRASDGGRIALPNLSAAVASGSGPPTSGPASSPPTFSVTPSGPGTTTQNRRRLAIGGAFAIAGLLLGVGFKWVMRPALPPSPGAAAPASRSSVGISAAPADPSRITVTLAIDVTPTKATVLLDGFAVAANPFRGVVARDSNVHRLVASAPGYVSEERTVVYDQDATIEMVLKKAAARIVGPTGSANASTTPAPGSDLKKAPHSKASIDEQDPYQ